jgi:hypothetical protein
LKPDGLTRYLDSLGESGRLDSEGVFTLDLNKGALKLQRHLLQNPEDYLLLAVRAAVAGGATEVKITLNYKSVHLEFSLDEEPLSEMMDGFIRAEDKRSRAAQILHFSVGGAFDQNVSEVHIVWPGWRLTANGQTLRGEVSEGRPGSVKVTFDRTGMGFLSRRKRTATEHRALSERCAFAPIPVRLDGRVLSGSEVTIKKRSQALPDNMILVDAYLRYGPDLLTVKPSSKPVWVIHDENSIKKKRDRSWAVGPGCVFVRIIEQSVGAFFHLNCLQGKGRLVVVKDGVCLEPIEDKSWLPGSRMVVRAESIETDLTQLRPRDSKELSSLRNWVAGQNRRLGAELMKEVPSLKGHPDAVSVRLKNSIMIGGVSVLYGAVGGPGCAFLMGGLGALIGGLLLGNSRVTLMETVEKYLASYRSGPSRKESISEQLDERPA